MLIQQFVDLLVHVLAFSPYYSPFQLQTQEQIQIPSTALEEAIMLLQVLSNCYSQMSISQVSSFFPSFYFIVSSNCSFGL